jgi:hypothetical protein
LNSSIEITEKRTETGSKADDIQYSAFVVTKDVGFCFLSVFANLKPILAEQNGLWLLLNKFSI